MVSERVIGPFGFPAENLLQEPVPPNYPLERTYLIIGIVMLSFFFLIFLPTLFAVPVPKRKNGENKNAQEKTNNDNNEPLEAKKKKGKATPATTTSKATATRTTTTSSSSGTTTKTTRIVTTKIRSGNTTTTIMKSSPNKNHEDVDYEVNVNALAICCFIWILVVVWTILVSSPDNYYTTRGVFEAPMLKREECNAILDMANRAALENYQSAKSSAGMYELIGEPENINDTVKALLEEPVGWQKLRHLTYPTTDLNLVTDPFTKEDQDYIKMKLDARLSPIIQRIFGVPPSAIRANDMFVVRYDDDKRSFLANHTDDASISFNILLNDSFEGGGTMFWHRGLMEPFAHVEPTQVGQVLLHSSQLNHEGYHVSKGTRTILVGFLSVDRYDPFKPTKHTGLSWFASWGSLAWTIVKFKQGWEASNVRVHKLGTDSWRDNSYIRSLYLDMVQMLNWFGDAFLPHFAHKLVADADREAFIEALDSAPVDDGASWFDGQQISVDITGEMTTVWQTRLQSSHRFMEEF